MKTTLFAVLMLLGAVPVRAAVVADNFNCTLNFASTDGSVNVTSSGELTAVRLPNAGPVGGSAATYTGANAGNDLSATIGGHAVVVSLSLSYQHIIATDSSGATRAGQSGCLAVYYSIDGQGIATSCPGMPYDPTDPMVGWNPVQLVDGVPSFDPSLLTPSAQDVGGLGTASVSCTYLNTNQ